MFKPMLAATPKDGALPATAFPLLATFKVDGIRALKIDGALRSRTLKRIPNRRVCALLERVLPDGCDGELVHGATFQSATSAVMTLDGPGGGFTYYVFDFVPGAAAADVPYEERLAALDRLLAQPATAALLDEVRPLVDVVAFVRPELVRSPDELDAFEARSLERGFEGVIVRAPRGRYKFGRSTEKERLMLKVKRFTDAEAVVTGAEELVHKDGRPGGALGALVAVATSADAGGLEFRIGTGYTAAQRAEFWRDRALLVGKSVKYKAFDVGAKDRPRFPVFLGFRHPDDA